MITSKIGWRDWDFGIGDWLEPFALERPGQLIYCPGDWFGEIDQNLTPENWLHRFHAVALLNQQHRFMLLTGDVESMRRYYASDPAPFIQAAAGQLLAQAAGAGPRLAPRLGFGLGERRMSSEEMAAEAVHTMRGAICAGLSVPQGQALLPNVWLGCRIASRNAARQALMLREFVRIPAAMRWLFIPGAFPTEFMSHVWGEELIGFELADLPPYKPGAIDIIETRPVPLRQIHWVVCGADNDGTAAHCVDQCEATGTPLWVEGIDLHSPLTLAWQMYPAEAEREPCMTPAKATLERKRRVIP